MHWLRAWGNDARLLPLGVAIGILPLLFFPSASAYGEIFRILVLSFFGITTVAGLLLGMFYHREDRDTPVFSRWAFFGLCAVVVGSAFSALGSVSFPIHATGLLGGDSQSLVTLGIGTSIAVLFLSLQESSRFFDRVIAPLWEVCGGYFFLTWIYLLLTGSSSGYGVTMGTPQMIGCFFAILLLLADRHQTGVIRAMGRIPLYMCAILSDAWPMWLLVVISEVLAYVFLPRRSYAKLQVFSAITVSFLGWILPKFALPFPKIPDEVVPSWGMSWHIVEQVWSHGLGWLFGLGGSGYAPAYALYTLSSVNMTPFWNVFFDHGFSQVMTFAVTGGFWMICSIGLLFAVGCYACFYDQKERLPNDNVLPAMFLLLSFWMTIYAWNVAMTVVWFSVVGLLASRVKSGGVLKMSKPLLLGVGVIFTTSFLVAVCRFGAVYAYEKAQEVQGSGKTQDGALLWMERATRWNRWDPTYFRELSMLLLARAAELIQEQAPSEQVQEVLRASLAAAVHATDIDPSRAENWETRGNVYRELIPLMDGADDFAIAAFSSAHELAPQNPRMLVGLGRAYTVQSEYLRLHLENQAASSPEIDEALKFAEKAFLDAKKMKPDYIPATYHLATVYERMNRFDDASLLYREVVTKNPQDVATAMRLVMVYLRQGKHADARVLLEQILTIAPTYANARWYLSLILEDAGDIDGALKHMRELQKTNPENSSVLERIQRLEDGEKSPIPEDETSPFASEQVSF